MKILVYGINYSPELTGIGKYTGEMVDVYKRQLHAVQAADGGLQHGEIAFQA